MKTQQYSARVMPMELVRAFLNFRGSINVHWYFVNLAVSGIVAKEKVEVAGLTVANQTFGSLYFLRPFTL